MLELKKDFCVINEQKEKEYFSIEHAKKKNVMDLFSHTFENHLNKCKKVVMKKSITELHF